MYNNDTYNINLFTQKIPSGITEICSTYNNYYFLVATQTESIFNNEIETNSAWTYNETTTLASLKTGISATEGIRINNSVTPKISKVCLVRDFSDKTPCEAFENGTDVIMLIDFWKLLKKTKQDGITHIVTETNENIKIYTDELKKYITQGKWNSENLIVELNELDINSKTVEELVNASVLPNELDVNILGDIINNPLSPTVKATINKTKPFNQFILPLTINNEEIIMSPVMYKVEYQLCKTIE